jgi:hypothetical protein
MLVCMALQSGATLSGRGTVRQGSRVLANVAYTIHVGPGNRCATVAEFDPKPPATDGDLVHLTLEDGRVLNCQIVDDSPYCAVVGDAPIVERRQAIRTE